MSGVTPQAIKELRECTSAGMSDCKNALVETAGDLEKAVEVILKKGLVKAASNDPCSSSILTLRVPWGNRVPFEAPKFLIRGSSFLGPAAA